MSKSPLRYPGGKSRAIHKIIAHFPKNIDFMSSHFVGGGSIELYLADQGVEIMAYDNFDLLINFWNQLKYNRHNLYNIVLKNHPISKDEFYKMQKSILNEKDNLKRAAMFYVLNRCSFSGLTLRGGMCLNHPRFTLNGINGLLSMNLDNIGFECLDFTDSIAKHKDNFKYLDPPYYTDNSLYGAMSIVHKNFDHLNLRQTLNNINGWVLSYNDCGYVRELYDGYEIIELDWNYGMGKSKKSNEILIINY